MRQISYAEFPVIYADMLPALLEEAHFWFGLGITDFLWKGKKRVTQQ